MTVIAGYWQDCGSTKTNDAPRSKTMGDIIGVSQLEKRALESQQHYSRLYARSVTEDLPSEAASRTSERRALSELKKTLRTRKQLCFPGSRASEVVEREEGLPNPLSTQKMD
ncbi:hypothetical protein NDU88_004265 [Pleurodeles waltl]|uniref:Uncharacterized protein n=1 Tax=Pleurodeles waltl TaxID=8319 RepID=A0AAV7RHQ2_PLEWA|nr:hypothetical protein NDU88_004265 [Pleurodeles waltl]